MSKIDEIKKYSDMLTDGYITQSEYEILKQKIIGTLNDLKGEREVTISNESIEREAEKRIWEMQKAKMEAERNGIVSTSVTHITKYEEQDTNIKRFQIWGLIIGIAILIIFALAIFWVVKTDASKKSDVNRATGENETVAKKTDNNRKDAKWERKDNFFIREDGNTITKDVLNVLGKYYATMNNDDFNANNYFSQNVVQFITLKSTTPSEINNAFEQSKSEFINAQSQIIDSSFTYERTQGGINYYKFKINYSCYRMSLNKQENCTTTIEVGFDTRSNKLTSYKETKIEDLEFRTTDNSVINSTNTPPNDFRKK